MPAASPLTPTSHRRLRPRSLASRTLLPRRGRAAGPGRLVRKRPPERDPCLVVPNLLIAAWGSTAVSRPAPQPGPDRLVDGGRSGTGPGHHHRSSPAIECGAGRQPARLGSSVPSPRKQISRSHCELRIDDWDVRLHDLGSNNGTYLTRPGQAPVRLDENVPTVLKPGDVVELGEEISFRMEE